MWKMLCHKTRKRVAFLLYTTHTQICKIYINKAARTFFSRKLKIKMQICQQQLYTNAISLYIAIDIYAYYLASGECLDLIGN